MSASRFLPARLWVWWRFRRIRRAGLLSHILAAHHAADAELKEVAARLGLPMSIVDSLVRRGDAISRGHSRRGIL
ncbi:hypothetical protein F0L68_33475 [Solihabitans fulvus]|uniref:Uncharacterized protein n=1 Tax=Solihabitans fulvus TaxID=1892852 RepID=A0A5B2WNF1_9PSEU|nr:hypothetical protein [Solihabitans fulvus]KAA2253321.1 hypothetical protein F0L68_33475 [Solihabitans fulvus]